MLTSGGRSKTRRAGLQDLNHGDYSGVSPTLLTQITMFIWVILLYRAGLTSRIDDARERFQQAPRPRAFTGPEAELCPCTSTAPAAQAWTSWTMTRSPGRVLSWSARTAITELLWLVSRSAALDPFLATTGPKSNEDERRRFVLN